MTPEKQGSPELEHARYDDLIAAVANHEAKALLIALMASKGKDRYFTSDQLDGYLLEIQGDEPTWKQGSGVPFSYCELSFEPIAAVAKSSLEISDGKALTAYSVTPFGFREAYALSGFVLDWSLRHPDISVQSLLGATQSRTDNRAPLHRLAILESIMTSEDGEATFRRIVEDHPELPGLGTITETTLKRSSLMKLVDVVTNQRNYDPLLNIIDTEYRGKRSYDMLTMERKAIYEALHELGVRRGLQSVRLGEFIETIAVAHPELNSRKIRAQLMQGIGPNRSGLPGLKVAEDGRGELGVAKSSKIRIRPEYIEAVSDFVNGIEHFVDGNNHEYWRVRAKEIIDSKEDCRILMKKGFENSTKARTARLAVPMAKVVFTLLQESDRSLSVPEIVHAIEEKFELKIGDNAIRNHLVKLHKEDQISKEEVTTIAHGRAQKRLHYSLKR